MKKILVIGSLNIDFVINVDKMPLPGETITGRDFSLVCGGKGANQAYAAAKLGGNVSMIGAVGNDEYGKMLINNFLFLVSYSYKDMYHLHSYQTLNFLT